MSTSWGFYCPEHEDASICDLNHGRAPLRILWDHRETIASLATVEDDHWRVKFDVVVWRDGYGHDPGLTRWVANHKDCAVQLVNEYGDREPIEPTPPCPANVHLGKTDSPSFCLIECQLGEDHYGQHHASGYEPMHHKLTWS